MGIKTSSQVVPQQVQKFIGTSFDTIQEVKNNLPAIQGLAPLVPIVNDLTTVIDSITDITTVADNVADVNSVADNMASILEVNVNTNEFNARFLGSKTSAPTVDNNGNPLQEGTLYWNSVEDTMYVYNNVWAVLAASGVVDITSLIGNGVAVTFPLDVSPKTKENTLVFINGVYQDKANYSVASNTLTFVTPPANGAAIEIVITVVSSFVTGVQEEKHTLTSGQTSVIFTASIAFASFYVQGSDVDSRRLDLGVDYLVNLATNTVTLSESYPENTVLKMLYGYADNISVELTPIIEDLAAIEANLDVLDAHAADSTLHSKDSTTHTHRGRNLDDVITARFDTVASMITDTDLVVGDVVETLYYNTDILQKWEIVPNLTGTADGGSYINLSGSGLQAKQIFGDRVSLLKYGLDPTVTTNQAAVFQKAVNSGAKQIWIDGNISWETKVTVPVGVSLIGAGGKLNPNAGTTLMRLNGNSSVTGCEFEGRSVALFEVYGNKNAIQMCKFKSGAAHELNQVVLLYTADYTRVQDCIFDNCGYGVIQQLGFVSNYGIVSGCFVINSKLDFIELNSATVMTKGWRITGNIFTGSADYPAAGTEERFFGATKVDDLIIDGNIIYNTSGDGAVHLEDAGGRVIISNNIFVDAFLNQGAIYNLNSGKDMTVQNNYFVMTDNYPFATENTCAIRTDSNNYSHECSISNNWFIDKTTGGKHLRPMLLAVGGNFTVHNNKCIDTYDMAQYNLISGAVFSNNVAYGQLQRGIWSNVGASGNAGDSNQFLYNKIPNLVETAYGIRAVTNSNGTAGPKRCRAIGNVIDGDIRLENLSGAAGQTAENVTTNNSVTGTIVCSSRIAADANGDYTVTAVI